VLVVPIYHDLFRK